LLFEFETGLALHQKSAKGMSEMIGSLLASGSFIILERVAKCATELLPEKFSIDTSAYHQ
jgi:hypothetical protein